MGKIVILGAASLYGNSHGRQEDDPGGLVGDGLSSHDLALAEFATWALNRALLPAHPGVEIGCRQAVEFGMAVRDHCQQPGYCRTNPAIIEVLYTLVERRTPGGNCAAKMEVVQAGLDAEYASACSDLDIALKSAGLRIGDDDMQWYMLGKLFRLLWMATQQQMQEHLLCRTGRTAGRQLTG